MHHAILVGMIERGAQLAGDVSVFFQRGWRTSCSEVPSTAPYDEGQASHFACVVHGDDVGVIEFRRGLRLAQQACAASVRGGIVEDFTASRDRAACRARDRWPMPLCRVRCRGDNGLQKSAIIGQCSASLRLAEIDRRLLRLCESH